VGEWRAEVWTREGCNCEWEEDSWMAVARGNCRSGECDANNRRLV